MKPFLKISPAFLLLLAPALALACPFCKETIAQTEGLGFARGIYYSIILLLGTFFGMVGVLVYHIVKQARKPPASWARHPR